MVKINARIIDSPLATEADPRLEEQTCELSIQDNGIGFDEKYSEKIFAMFQRLHGRNEYEGTGVGLAVCRRITDRHGGTIRAYGKLGEGATFVVTLPVHHFAKATEEPGNKAVEAADKAVEQAANKIDEESKTEAVEETSIPEELK